MNRPRVPRKNVLEWFVFAVSLALIGTLLAVLAWAALWQQDTTIRLEVTAETAYDRNGQFIVPVIVRNRGGAPAAGVQVEIIVSGGDPLERGAVEIPYVPAQALRRAEVPVATDPANARVTARIVGYRLQ